MNKNYEKIEFSAGKSIDSAIKKLNIYKEAGLLAFGTFNGMNLYSDVDDLETAYLKITGLSKSDFDKKMNDDTERYKKEKEEHENSIPELTKKWVAIGHEFLDEKYHKLWDECVPIRLSDLYSGFELECCIEIIKELNNNSDFRDIKKMVENQGHSGMSFGLICSMLKSFHDKGEEFVNFLNEK